MLLENYIISYFNYFYMSIILFCFFEEILFYFIKTIEITLLTIRFSLIKFFFIKNKILYIKLYCKILYNILKKC